jgi:hypothetical protein
MQAIEAREAEMPEWGRRGRELAAPYGAEFWAARWAGAIAEGTTA